MPNLIFSYSRGASSGKTIGGVDYRPTMQAGHCQWRIDRRITQLESRLCLFHQYNNWSQYETCHTSQNDQPTGRVCPGTRKHAPLSWQVKAIKKNFVKL